jgi:hypothetical protein
VPDAGYLNTDWNSYRSVRRYSNATRPSYNAAELDCGCVLVASCKHQQQPKRLLIGLDWIGFSFVHETVRMPVNFHLALAFNKFFAEKQKMQQNDENARTSNNARAAIGGDLRVEDGGDDEASRDTFEVKAVMVPDDGSNGSSITKEGGREVTWFVDRHGSPYDSPYEKEYSAETIEEIFHEVSEFFGSLKVLDPTQDTEHLRFAKSRLRDFKTYSNTVENSFITAVCCARGKL